MIRSNDPQLKATEGELFKDSDFEEGAAPAKAGKPMTYKD